ncbi:hypothetical protein TSAR_011188 [Trichomalopsis sarcophagae]|uniref:Uncharacterized protein n=1 Tax=Trichomalopsis sarcophagae TaxID=543379 RepID=A0A232F467_9HYME|nr:hypothetical protein TSAR_011188 [Trichomalopsis sarcophagae]
MASLKYHNELSMESGHILTSKIQGRGSPNAALNLCPVHNIFLRNPSTKKQNNLDCLLCYIFHHKLRAECELLHLLLVETNRALILERRQHRKSPTADATALTEPAPDRQHSSAQTDLSLLTTPMPQPRPNSRVIIRHAERRVVRTSAADRYPNTAHDSSRHPGHPPVAAGNPDSSSHESDNTATGHQSEDSGQADHTAQEHRHFSTEEDAAGRKVVPRIPGHRRKPRVISNEILKVPLPLPLGKTLWVEEKTPPEPMASVAVDLTTSD